MAERISLPNGAKASIPSVNPKNYKRLKKERQTSIWYVWYYYYSKEYPKGKLKIIKRMNEYKLTDIRIAVTDSIIDNEITKLKRGWNPIEKKYVFDETLNEGEMHPQMLFIEALKCVFDKKKATDNMKKEYRIFFKRLTKATYSLSKENITIIRLTRRDVKFILDEMNLPDNYYNKIRGYLSSLFSDLIEYECIDSNPCTYIKKKKVSPKKKVLLSDIEYRAVMKHLHKNHYTYYRYVQIFNYSGSRSTELLRIKKEDVNLEKQEFTIEIWKGRDVKRVTKAILPAVHNLWVEAYNLADKGQYIFSKDLVPGDNKIDSQQIGKRWRRLVKNVDIQDDNGNTIKITSTFYSLKHYLLDSLPSNLAMFIAGHTKPSTTDIYRVNREEKELEELKNLKIDFLKVV